MAALVLLAGCAGKSFEPASDSNTGGAGAGSQSVAGSGGSGVAGAVSLGGSAGDVARGGNSSAGTGVSTAGQGTAGGDVGELGGAGGEPSSSPPAVECDREGWSLQASASSDADPPANALDGSSETRWASGVEQAPGQWLELAFGRVLTLEALELVSSEWPADVPSMVALELDGVAVPVLITTDAGLLRVTFEPSPASSARLELVAPGLSWWSVGELGGKCRP